MTSGNSQTLTLSGYNGYEITQIKLSMSSNTKGGAGKLYYSTDGGSSWTYIIGTSTSGVAFNQTDWYGSWSTSYVDITKSDLSISCGSSDVIIKIEATANSLYCQSYTLTYSAADNTDYTITIDNANIENGSVAASASTAKAGTEITLTATPESGYKLSAWDVKDASDNAVTVTNNVTVGATFALERTITISDAEHGSVVADPATACKGETVTLTATPDTNYELSAVTVTNNSTSASVATSGTGNTRTFVMPDAAVTVAPVFALQKGIEENPFTVSEALAYITGGGTGNKYTRGIVSEVGELDNSSTLTYYISDDGTTTNQMTVFRGKNLGNTNFSATTDLEVGDRVVVYGPVTYYKNTTPEYTTGNYLYSISRDFTFTLDAIANGSVVIQVDGETQTPDGDGEVAIASGANVTLTATPNSGYTFAKWTCTDGTYNNSVTNPLDFVMPFDDIMFGANFLDENQEYDIVVDDGITGGAIESDKEQAKAGETVTLTATPAANYVFGAWDVQDENAVAVDVTNNQFTMPASDVIVTATFKKVHTVTYYIGGVENTTTRVDGEELNLDAPSTSFAGWSSANSAASPVFVDNSTAVTSDMTVYAVFVASQSVDYCLVESNQTDWRGDYLIAYSSSIFADGRVGGTDGMGKQYTKATPGDKLSGTTVDVEWGDTYHVTLEAIDDADLSKGYVLKTQDGKYNYQSSNSNGLAASPQKGTAATYPITVTFTSSSDVKLKLGGGAQGAVFRYNTSGYFRFYKDGGQSAVYLYKRVDNSTYSLDVYDVVTIGESGYASYCSANDLDFTNSDVKAYKAKVNDANVVLTAVDKVPAEEGVVLYCETPGTYYIPAAASAPAVADNEMVGVIQRTQVLWNPTTGVYNYILQQGEFNKANDGYLKPNRAYLSTSYDVSASGAKALSIVFDGGTTGIGELKNSSIEEWKSAPMYNLAGQRVSNGYRGIVIVNGKKYVK